MTRSPSLIQLRQVTKTYGTGSAAFRALKGIDLDIDGPVERMIKKGAYRIMVIDWTMGGPRFSKTFDVVEMSKRALDDWKTKYGVTVPLTWVNDYSNLMEESYPIEPEGWTRILKNPTVDSDVLLSGRPNPVVLDPVLAAGGGTNLVGPALLESIRLELLPCLTLITPNSLEAKRLTGLEDLDDCASELLSLGCDAVLITGTHEQSREVRNRLYLHGEKTNSIWPRLQGEYHGSGCTLAAAITAFLALGRPLQEAVLRGQEFTWKTLSHGYRPGRGQALPDRFFSHRRRS